MPLSKKLLDERIRILVAQEAAGLAKEACMIDIRFLVSLLKR
jgi:hypothetical protein